MVKKKGPLASPFVSAEEQPYPIPENWCWEYGVSIFMPMETQKPNGEMFRYIDIESIDNKQQAVSEPKEMPVTKAPSRASRKLHSGDTIFSMVRPYLKNIAYIDETISDAIASTGFYICTPRENVNSRYNYYMMISPYVVDGLNAFMKGDNSPSIRKDDIEGFPYPIPPLPEQQRIVDRIESLFAKLDEAKEKAQTVVDGFELRKSAILHKAFTGELTERWRKEHGVGLDSWQKTNIGSIADVKGGKRVPKGMSLTTDDTGHPYIKAGNLKLGTVLDEGIMFVTDDVLQYIKNYTVTAGDVYITNVGACIGDCGIIPDKYDGANLTENAVKITNLKCNGQFLARYISSNEVQQRIKNLIASATLGKLSIANIKTISVTLPTDIEQAETIRILEQLLNKEQQAKEAAEAVLAQIDTMKKAILARAFRGELGTNDPAEEWAGEMVKKIL